MPLVVFSALRVGLLLVAVALLWLVGMRDWLLVVVAAVIAWAVSYAVLGRQRDAAALWLADRTARRARSGRPAGRDRDADAEDAEADGRHNDRPRPSSTP